MMDFGNASSNQFTNGSHQIFFNCFGVFLSFPNPRPDFYSSDNSLSPLASQALKLACCHSQNKMYIIRLEDWTQNS